MNMDEQLLNFNDLQALGEQANDIIYPEANMDFVHNISGIVKRVRNDLNLVNIIIQNQGKIEPALETKLMTQLFADIITLRTFFTGQRYMLQIGYYGGTWQAPLDNLFQQEELIVRNGQIEYAIKDIRTSFQKINNFNKDLKNLNNKLFYKNGPLLKDKFIYRHSNGDTSPEGRFFQENFAMYRQGGIQHYFVPQRLSENVLYNKTTAKYYNRGHVYEWFLADINKKNLENGYSPDPVTFMRDPAHNPDNVAFIRGGDYRTSQEGIIYAVQVKKINNKKLISYTQIRNTLQILSGLGTNISKTKFKEIVKKAFVSQEKNINRGAKAQIDKKVDELFNILTLGN